MCVVLSWATQTSFILFIFLLNTITDPQYDGMYTCQRSSGFLQSTTWIICDDSATDVIYKLKSEELFFFFVFFGSFSQVVNATEWVLPAQSEWRVNSTEHFCVFLWFLFNKKLWNDERRPPKSTEMTWTPTTWHEAPAAAKRLKK